MKRVPHILVIADAAISAPLCDYLNSFKFKAVAAADVAAVDAQLAAQRIDLVVLDLMLHGVNGLALTRALRSTLAMSIILLSGHGSAAERVVGLEMGADDCMDHPLVRRELVAPIHAVLRRAVPVAPVPRNLVRFDGWELRRRERHLRSPAGAAVPLSNAEFQLLQTFLQAPRRVMSRDELAAPARGQLGVASGRSIDLLVSRLRQKLLHPGVHDGVPISLIRTVRGVGYRFEARSVEGAA
jgi:two-component system OmpR family response regulator